MALPYGMTPRAGGAARRRVLDKATVILRIARGACIAIDHVDAPPLWSEVSLSAQGAEMSANQCERMAD